MKERYIVMPNYKRSDLTKILPLPLYRQIFARQEWHTNEIVLPNVVREWLCHTDSLTQKLQAQCDELTVEITEESWQAVSFAKKSANQTAWVREVVLKCDRIPAIFAQTILPEETVNAVARDVLTLGDTPIGLWLFPQNPQRINLEWGRDAETGLYARRSLLELHGYPLEIKELFLEWFDFS